MQKQTQRYRKQTYGYQSGQQQGKRRDNLGIWDEYIHTIKIYKIDNENLLQLYSRELYSTSCDDL